ncbi:hypothetical protein E2C01_009984 [Portunus trituberculatus]|uniref:Uncharacterized protein n=1 Tax=Portunus trituberculatus TaxID=210409 RepID=A0A5B7D7G2_PORTR|nr:hypothetical protein [Portunus trituberculatus]
MQMYQSTNGVNEHKWCLSSPFSPFSTYWNAFLSRISGVISDFIDIRKGVWRSED